MPNDLAKLSNVIKNVVAKKTDYNVPKSKVDGIDVSKYVGITEYETDGKAIYDKTDAVEKKISALTNFVMTARFNHKKKLLATKTALTTVESKIPDVTSFVKKTDFDSKITEVEGKIPNISGLATASALTAVENKIPDATNLVKKTDFDAKLKGISDRVTNNKSKDLLLDSELKKLKTLVGSTSKTKFDKVQIGNSFTRGFYYYLQQSYLVYECKTFSFKKDNNDKLTTWKFTGIDNLSVNSDLNFSSSVTANFMPLLENNGRMNVNFNGYYLAQNKAIHPNNNKVVSIYIVYELGLINNYRTSVYTTENALFGAIKITKNADTSKYKYKGYGICFEEGGTFSEGSISNGRKVLIFGVHESFLFHSNNKANNIYVMVKEFVQGINDTTLYADKVYSQNFTQPSKKFVLSLHYNGDNSYLFVNGKLVLKFKSKDDQIINEKLCLGNLSTDWNNNEVKHTGLLGKVYDFVVDYEAIDGVRPIYDMHRYLMTKHNIE